MRSTRVSMIVLLPAICLGVACAAVPDPGHAGQSAWAGAAPAVTVESTASPGTAPPAPPTSPSAAPSPSATASTTSRSNRPTPGTPHRPGPVSTPTPSPVVTTAHFGTLPPGSPLPDDAQCASRVRRSAWEPRPQNAAANHTVPASVSLPGWTPDNGGVDARARALADRVTGDFTGTTDEIIQWASCKWGFDEDTVRAVAVDESYWRESHLGDYTDDASLCQTGYAPPCPESFGLLQVRGIYHPGTFPSSRDSTAFNVDYALLFRRVCYEGWMTWVSTSSGGGGYGAGDDWGCVGLWFSGRWRDPGALSYISTVQGILARRPWLAPGF